MCVCVQGEIDAREDSFVACAEAGERLVNSNHYAAEEVQEKVRILHSVGNFTFNYTYYTVTHECLRSTAYSYSCLVQ